MDFKTLFQLPNSFALVGTFTYHLKAKCVGAIVLFSIISTNTLSQKFFNTKAAANQYEFAFNKEVPKILKKIKPPIFLDKIVTITDTLNFKAKVQDAINKLSANGGGIVVINEGNYLCNGPIHLKNNINLHISKNAIIKFGINPNDYLPVVKVRWEGTVCYNYSPLIYAYQQKNIAITGQGVLDGQANKFWYAWKKQPDGNDQEKTKKIIRDYGRDMVEEEKRIFGDGFKLRPSLIELYECENILIDSITLQESPFWTTHPVFCKNTTIQNITIKHGTTNDDGIDPDGCQNMLIQNCKIDTDDDPISIKAGRDNDAWQRMATKNIIIKNIRASSKVGNGFCIGSEMSAGVQRVYVQDYYITKADNGINIKSNLDRGGFVKNIYLKNMQIDTCTRNGIMLQKDYHSYRGGNSPSTYNNIFLSNVSIRFVAKKGLRIVGVKEKSIDRVWFNKVTIKTQHQENETNYLQNFIQQ